MNLLLELRRRQMFRLVGLYIVGAWAVIQVADIAFPTWGIPDSAIRYLFYAALLCFPIALVFGWIFDIRSDGIYRTKRAGADDIVDTKARWQDYLILAALAGIGAYILLGSVQKIRTEPVDTASSETSIAVERHENGVAVLPFDNLDSNPDTRYFSDGVADEILSRLANIRTLFVVGRTSSFSFSQSDAQPAAIAGMLGVRYLLSGTVRRDGELVRITARLMDDEGAHVWSQSFDRKLEQIFAVQSEIADSVSQRVAREVSPPDAQSPTRATENVDAYRNYLLGKQLFTNRPGGWADKARGLFREAIELDPNFAPAYAYLVITQLLFDYPEARIEEMEAAASKALALDANLAEAHVAMGVLYRIRDEDFDAAIAAFRRAIDLNPALWIANNLLGNTLRMAQRPVEARQVYMQGLERDPLNPVSITNVAFRYAEIGEFEKAEQLMLRLLSLPQIPDFAFARLSDLYFELGKIDESIKWRKKEILMALEPLGQDPVPEVYFGKNLEAFWYAFSFGSLAVDYLVLGMEDHATYWWNEHALPLFGDSDFEMVVKADACRWLNDSHCLKKRLTEIEAAQAQLTDPDALARLGQLLIVTGRVDEGIEVLQRNKRNVDMNAPSASVLGNEVYRDALHYLALGHRLRGEDEAADQLLQTAGDWTERKLESEALNEGNFLMELAVNRWHRGNREGAIELAQQAIDAGWIQLYFARHDPLKRELLEQQELQVALLEVEQRIQRQRAIVEAAEETEDFREKVSRGMAALSQHLAQPE